MFANRMSSAKDTSKAHTMCQEECLRCERTTNTVSATLSCKIGHFGLYVTAAVAIVASLPQRF